jgi:hypothetical protein
MRGDDGRTYSLAGELRGFRPCRLIDAILLPVAERCIKAARPARGQR